MKVDKDMVTSFLQIQPDNLIRKAALGKGGDAAGSAVWLYILFYLNLKIFQ